MPNYRIQRKLEHVYTLRYYNWMVKEPATAENAPHIRKLQDLHLQELMRIAYDFPFYRERFERSHTTPDDYKGVEDLYKFPLLTKDELRDWMDAELASNPEKYKYWHEVPTSGSTGRPLRVLRSPHESAFGVANWLRMMTMAGYNPFTGKTLSRPNSLHLQNDKMKERDSFIQRFGILRHKYMSDTIKQRIDTKVLVDEINAYKPDFLYTHKNVLVRIAKYAKDNNIEIWRPKFYSPVSEMLDQPSNELLRDVFGPGLLDVYGLTETDGCVVRLPGLDYFQVCSDSYAVNVYNADLSGPSDSGMAVITPLMKRELPVINYVTLDYLDSYVEHGLRFISRVQGRMNDYIYHSDGSVTEWGNISVVMNYIREVVQYRIVQEDLNSVNIIMVRNPDTPSSENAAIEARVEKGLRDIFKDDSMGITFEWVDDIPADPNGKMRVIVSKVQKP